jgi:hypothetical protein
MPGGQKFIELAALPSWVDVDEVIREMYGEAYHAVLQPS